MTDITPPPPHLLKKFSEQAREDSKKRGHPGYCKTFAILCIEWAMNSQSTPNDRQIRSSVITPPPELVQQWLKEADAFCYLIKEEYQYIATRAAQWGAGQELEACCHYFARDLRKSLALELRAARRPKPPSLKEQSLALIDLIQGNEKAWDIRDLNVVRRALEALPDD